MRYETNELGDVVKVVHDDGRVENVDPSTWGWLKKRGKNDPSERRRSVASLVWLPGFDVSTTDASEHYEPGPKPTGRGASWRPGAAPPVVVESDGGTRALFDRVSEAAAHVAESLPRRALVDGETTMTIWDHISALQHRVTYRLPGEQDPDKARVYVLDDGFAFKVGITSSPVAVRVQALQTGNPRRISVVAEIANADPGVESAIHDELHAANISGEWFDRAKVIDRIHAAGSVKAWLQKVPAVKGLPITVHAPYR